MFSCGFSAHPPQHITSGKCGTWARHSTRILTPWIHRLCKQKGTASRCADIQNLGMPPEVRSVIDRDEVGSKDSGTWCMDDQPFFLPEGGIAQSDDAQRMVRYCVG